MPRCGCRSGRPSLRAQRAGKRLPGPRASRVRLRKSVRVELGDAASVQTTCEHCTGRKPALAKPQVVAREIIDRAAAHEPHPALDFGPQKAQCPFDAGLARRRKRVEVEATNPDRFGTQRKGFQDMRPALDSSIHQYIDSVTHRVDDFGELIESRARAVELATAMVRQDDASASDVDRALRIGHRHDSLETELTVPKLDHLGYVVPGH